ncbi:MAG: hypothetical protein WBG66_12350 [Geitlerinemataceae cyanobacterium]
MLKYSTIDREILQKNLDRSLQFIREFEARHFQDSTYEIANKLRQHTRASYNSKQFTLATLSRQTYIDNRLDCAVLLAGQVTDFAHFIASLSDRVRLSGWMRALDATTAWTGKHSSWAGDLAQAVLEYRSGKFATMAQSLLAVASPADLSADVAAVQVGELMNTQSRQVSEAIAIYQDIPYSLHVRQFIQQELEGKLVEDRIHNSHAIVEGICRDIAEFLILMEVKNIAWTRKFNPKVLQSIERNHPDVRSATQYFLDYLIPMSELEVVV